MQSCVKVLDKTPALTIGTQRVIEYVDIVSSFQQIVQETSCETDSNYLNNLPTFRWRVNHFFWAINQRVSVDCPSANIGPENIAVPSVRSHRNWLPSGIIAQQGNSRSTAHVYSVQVTQQQISDDQIILCEQVVQDIAWIIVNW